MVFRTWLVAATVLAVAAFVVVAAGGSNGVLARMAAPAVDTRYVSPSGSDRNPGTFERPWRTLGRGVRSLRPGQRLRVRAGTYPEWVVVARSGAPGHRIVIEAYPGEWPVVTGRLKIEGDHVRVSGIRFEGGTSANRRGVLIYVAGGDDVVVSRCEITGAVLSGIYLEGADGARVVHNRIHHNGTHDNLDHGIYWSSGEGGLVAGNVVYDNHAKGIQLYPDADGIVVSQNTVVGNGRIGIVIGGEGTTSDRNVIVNNVVAFNDWEGIRGYWGGHVGVGNEVLNNLVFGNGRGSGRVDVAAHGLEVRENLSVDPLFAELDAGDFHLAAGSPAVDRAVRRYSLRTDLEGRPRLVDRAPDLGAYER